MRSEVARHLSFDDGLFGVSVVGNQLVDFVTAVAVLVVIGAGQYLNLFFIVIVVFSIVQLRFLQRREMSI